MQRLLSLSLSCGFVILCLTRCCWNKLLALKSNTRCTSDVGSASMLTVHHFRGHGEDACVQTRLETGTSRVLRASARSIRLVGSSWLPGEEHDHLPIYPFRQLRHRPGDSTHLASNVVRTNLWQAPQGSSRNCQCLHCPVLPSSLSRSWLPSSYTCPSMRSVSLDNHVFSADDVAMRFCQK